MKLLKKIIIIALPVVFALWGCSDDDDETVVGSNDTISLSRDVIQMDNEGGSAVVTVTSSGDWRLSGVCDWASPSATSGQDGDNVTFTIEPNDQEEVRTATFKFFTGSSVAALQIESAPGYTLSLLSDANLSVTNSETTITVQLSTNITDPVISFTDGGEEWVTYSRTTEFGDATILTFSVSENATYIDRSTAITISSPLVDAPVSVDLTQERTEAILIEDEEDLVIYDLTQRTVTLKVSANVEYEVSGVEGTDWITNQSTSEAVDRGDGLSTITYTYLLDEATSTRSATIKYASSSLSDEITLVQKDPAVDLVEIPDATFRSFCESSGWVLVIAGSQCVVLEEGLNATTLTSSNRFGDLAGIENFPNLTTINLNYCYYLSKIDLSGLHKVSTFTVRSTYYVSEFVLGDNPITTFSLADRYNMYSYVSSLTFSSEKLESLDLSLYNTASYYVNRDCVTSIDVSDCPSLTTLNADRTSKVTTLYLKTGQEITNLTKNDATEIVYK